MNYLILIGNVVGYIVACLIYDQRLPLLSIPSIVGVLIGGAISFSVLPILALLDKVNKPERSMTKEEWKKEYREGREEDYKNFRSQHTKVDSLIYALNDEDERVQGYAARALEEIKDSCAVEQLIATLKLDISVVECKYIVRNIKILGEIGDKRAVEPLREVSKKALDTGVRKAAIKAITKIKQTNRKP